MRQLSQECLTPNPTIMGLSSSSLLQVSAKKRPISGAWKVKMATDPDTSPYNR